MVNDEGLTVLGLHIENVKCIKVVDLSPPATGPVKIRGKNRAGKSSTIDAIGMAISSEDVPGRPIRMGEKEGGIVLRLGEGLEEKYIVRKKFTEKGIYLDVSAKHDGQTMKMASPQKFLDDLRGAGIAFDPREFCSARPADQVQMLLSVLQLSEDPRMLDADRAKLYAQRTELNRQVIQAKSVLDAENAKPLIDVPDTEVSVSSLLAELEQRQAQVIANTALRDAAEATKKKLYRTRAETAEEVKKTEKLISEFRIQIADLQEKVEALVVERDENRPIYEGMLDELRQDADAAEKAAEGLVDPDIQAAKQQIADAEATNREVRMRQAEIARRAELAKHHGGLVSQSNMLTDKIGGIDDRKEAIYGAAQFPIEGLAVAQDSKGGYFLTYHEIPVTQCSASEQMEIGMSIAGALNPRLKIILIREASLMDEDTQAKVASWVNAHGYQVWEEIVGTDGDGFVIEEGEVRP